MPLVVIKNDSTGGTANTGGGGGGLAVQVVGWYREQAGGKGIVIIRYKFQ